jgi:hypothetical protein
MRNTQFLREQNVGPTPPTVRFEMEAVLAGARSTWPFVRSAPAHSSLLPPCGSGKKQTRNMASVAASLGPAGMKPTEAKKSSMGAG